MSTTYDASAIEVLSGLDPVRRRPSMFTETVRPNHLAQEVIDTALMKPLLAMPGVLTSRSTPTARSKSAMTGVACRSISTPRSRFRVSRSS